MAKPSKKKAVETKPEPTAEELKADIAKFDHDGDGHPGGSLPHHAEEQQPEVDTAEQTVEAESEQTTEPEAAPVESEPQPEPEAPETDAHSQSVMLGSVECRLRRVPVETVLGLLNPEGLRRIEAHQGTASFESTRQRLLATDGRATPVVFEAGRLAGDPPTILHGFEELAAARVSGVPDIPVILVPTGGASEAQSHIVEMVRQQRAKGQPSDDDEMFYRVNAAE